jgi:hypothetical protein
MTNTEQETKKMVDQWASWMVGRGDVREAAGIMTQTDFEEWFHSNMVHFLTEWVQATEERKKNGW